MSNPFMPPSMGPVIGGRFVAWTSRVKLLPGVRAVSTRSFEDASRLQT